MSDDSGSSKLDKHHYMPRKQCLFASPQTSPIVTSENEVGQQESHGQNKAPKLCQTTWCKRTCYIYSTEWV